MSLKVVVIGCGPAGLAAAHAAIGLDCDVRIIAPKKQTLQRGPVMLHRPIPGINTEQPDGYVRQLVIGGSILDYRLKLYGDVNISISGDILDPGFHTWRLPEAYDKMWQMYSGLIEDAEVSPWGLDNLTEFNDLVVSTAPARNLCWMEGKEARFRHEFTSVPIALKFHVSYPDQPENTVIYNAYQPGNSPLSASSWTSSSDASWVRSSDIFGAKVTEYKPEDCPDPDLIIHKPISTNCVCHPRVLRTGRFGKWHNETWIDHAYYDTRTALYSMLHQQEWDSVK